MGIFDFLKRELRGNKLLEQKNNNPKVASYFEMLYKEGVKDADIVEWWNMPDSEMKAVQENDDIAKLATVKALINQGMSQEDAFKQAFQTFPIYGDPKEESKLRGDNRPLPYELKNRINTFIARNANNKNKLKEESGKYSSMNAYIRQLVEDGEI